MNLLYDSAREAFMNGDIDWVDDDIKLAIVNISGATPPYTVDQAGDSVLSDISPTLDPGVILFQSETMTGRTNTGGVADADDMLFLVTTSFGGQVAAVIYQDTGDVTTSRLITYQDEIVTGDVLITSGNLFSLRFSNSPTKIFKL